MTRQSSFKRIVRARMEKTGESYAAARASLLAAGGAADAQAGRRRCWRRPTTPSASAPAAAGRSGSTSSTRGAPPSGSHREIARWVAEQLGIHPLAWNAQAITMSYERARGGRRSASARTASPSPRRRRSPCPSSGSTTRSPTRRRAPRWLPDAPLRERTATRPVRRPATTGATTARACTSRSPRGRREGHAHASSTPGCATPTRPPSRRRSGASASARSRRS